MNDEQRESLRKVGYNYYLIFGNMVDDVFIIDESIKPFCVKAASQVGPMMRKFYKDSVIKSYKINVGGSI